MHLVEIMLEARNIIAFHGPVTLKNGGERFGCRPLDARHSVNPFPHARILFEVGGVHHIHAAGPGDRAIDCRNLAM